MSGDLQTRLRRLRRWGAPLLFVVLTGGLAWVFRSVLLPFLVALFIVYVIEPVVEWLTRQQVRGRSVPRGGAVALVFAVILGGAGTGITLLVPPFAREVASLATEAPRALRTFREEVLPGWNARVQRATATLLPPDLTDAPMEAASDRVREAALDARAHATVASGLPTGARSLAVQGAVSFEVSRLVQPAEAVWVRVRPGGDGSFELVGGDGEIEFERVNGSTWRLRQSRETTEEAPVRGFDLERAVNQELTGLVDASREGMTELVTVGQKLAAGVLNALVSIFLTLMVAAFVSADVPQILGFVRGLFAPETQGKVTALLGALDRGLAGVIRGQLVVCVVNGTLTGVGLWLLDVKFALTLALFATVLSLIPIFGTIISTIPAVLVGLTGGAMKGVLVLGWILLIHFIEANFLNPKIIGGMARIHPAIVVFALVAGEHGFGLLGALLAVPVASMIQTLFQFAREHLGRASGEAESRTHDEDPA